MLQLTQHFYRRPAASREAIDRAEAELGARLPAQYVELMMDFNGGEGFVGDNPESYLALWSIEDIPVRNRNCYVREFASSLLLFASDGAEEAYAFDLRFSPHGIVQVPFVPLTMAEARLCGQSMTQFLEFLASRNAGNIAEARDVPRVNPELVGYELHEIVPVKFGGSPTDPANKVRVTGAIHDQYTVWWNQRLRELHETRS